jgi:hypothetical protein
MKEIFIIAFSIKSETIFTLIISANAKKIGQLAYSKEKSYSQLDHQFARSQQITSLAIVVLCRWEKN